MDYQNIETKLIEEIHLLNKEHIEKIEFLIKDTLNSKKPNLFNIQTEEQKKETNKKLINLIIEFEGLKLDVYRDTENFLTIGYGHKLTQEEINSEMYHITLSQAKELLKKDIKNALKVAKEIYPNYEQHKPNVRLFMVLQAFNMGYNLRSFKISNPALINFDYKLALHGFKKSKWCKQVRQNRCNKTLQLLRDAL